MLVGVRILQKQPKETNPNIPIEWTGSAFIVHHKCFWRGLNLKSNK